MDIKIGILAEANFAQARAQMEALQKQAQSLNATIAGATMMPLGGSPQGYRKVAAAMNAVDSAFNSALASSGAFRVEQLKVNDAVNRNTDLLQKNKLKFGEVFGKEAKANMRAIYHEQLRLQNSYIKTNNSLISDGKMRATFAIPTEVHESWDTLNNRVGMFAHQLSSASEQMINWGKNTQWAGRQLMVGFTMPVAAFGAAAGVLAYQTDKIQSHIVKVYDFSAAAQKDSAVREQEALALRNRSMEEAISIASKYGNSITETLEVQKELAATGLTGNNLFSTSSEVQRISTLGDIDPSQTTEMVVALQTAFKDTIRNSDDLTNTLNFMNAAAAATSLDLQDIAEATPRAATGIAQLGGTAEEMTILLVSMREAGVDAASGANALKSATTRIINPVKKANEFYEKYGINLQNIANQSGGNLFEYLKILGEEQQKINGTTEEQTALLRQQGIAALFGTYQFNRLNASLVNLGDAYAGVDNQTAKALELQGLDAAELAKRADASMKDVSESISGRFRRALETLKGELAVIGEDFLAVGTNFLKAITNVVSAFNNLPDQVKNFVFFTSIIMALVGPLVMIIGLFANFMGNIGKFGAFLLKAASSFEVLNKSQWATKMSLALTNKGFITQADSVQMLTQEVNALSTALGFAAKQMSAVTGIPMPMDALLPEKDVVLQGMYNQKTGRFHDPETNKMISADAARLKAEQIATANIANSRKEELLHNQGSLDAKRKQAVLDAEGLSKDEASAKIKSRMSGYVNTASVSTGLMTASMLAMVGPSNAVTDGISKWGMIAAIVLPAVAGLAGFMKNVIVPAATLYAGKMKAAAAAAIATSAATARSAGKGAAVAAGARGLGAGALGVMGGPAGLAIAGLAVAGGLLYKIHKDSEEAIQKQIDQQKALNKTTEDWVGILKVAKKEREAMPMVGLPSSSYDPTEFQNKVETFKSSETGAAFLDAYNAEGVSEAEQATMALGQYINILRNTDATAKQAKRGLEIMFVAAGEGAIYAQTKAEEIYKIFGEVGSQDMQQLWSRQFTDLFESGTDESRTAGQEMGKNIAMEIASAVNTIGRNGVIDDVISSTQASWQTLIGTMESSSQSVLSNIGIDGTNVRSFIAEWHKVIKGELSQDEFMVNFGLDSQDSGDVMVLLREMDNLYAGAGGKADSLRQAEKGIVQELSKQLGISQELATLNELRSSWQWRLYTATKANSKELIKQRMAELDAITSNITIFGWADAIHKKNKEMVREQVRAAVAANGYGKELKGAADKAGEVSDEIKKIPKSIRISITADDVSGIARDAMSALQDQISDRLMDARTNYWDNQASALQDRQDAASAALDRRQEAAQVAFDARWERRTKATEKYYDTRIEGINEEIEAEQKAEEIRQRIFEAEQRRIDRLNESANMSIDFNLALQSGDLDEAAKLRNDMEAQAQTWALEDAGRGNTKKSDKRTQILEERIEKLEEGKDQALEALKKEEDAERRSFDRRLEAQKNYLQASQEANMEALDARAEADKKSLEEQLETFKAFVPKNQKQLEDWMDRMGITYEDFGVEFLKPTANDWGRFYKDSFMKNVEKAGLEVASDNMWESMGKEVAEKTLKGMGFDSLGALERFVTTGKLPSNFLETSKNAGKTNNSNSSSGDQFRPNAIETWHTGGIVGSGPGSRKGVARTAGMHKSEQMVRAQKGEYIINRAASSKYKNELNAINNGVFDPMSSRRDPGVMGGMGLPGLMAGVIGRLFATGVSKALTNGISDKIKSASNMPSVGNFGNLAAGSYGGTAFTAEQLNNARTIANVGKSLGASSRDIVIALMTAMQESTLRNLSYGDRDSVGLFQQRDAWGSFEARTNPEQAARMFFLGGAQGQRGLFDFPGRNSMSLTEAAQAVQVSAYPDAYAKWAEEATAIYKSLTSSGGGTSGSVIPGSGGNRPPVDRPWSSSYNIHGSPPAVDLGVPVGRNVYAAGSGKVITSADITGHEPRAPHGGLGYRSYGRYVVIGHDNGAQTLYAHLSQRYARAGQRVSGGSVIGKSGNTGYSFGPHLHFGASNGPMAWLKTGGNTLSDGMAMLHKNETVLTKPLSKDLKDTVSSFGMISRNIGWENVMAGLPSVGGLSGNSDNIASGGNTEYNIEVNVMQPSASADEIVKKTIRAIDNREARGPKRK